MVDFKKLRAENKLPILTDPLEIFRRLPKPIGINDLYTSQASVLEDWYKRRTERDLVIKLHTGGGKTLVGLLLAQATLNELNQPVIYLASTKQLVEQTVNMAQEYGLSAVAYAGIEIPTEYYNCKSVLVCSYQALFNGKSRFGIRGSGKTIVPAGLIILDDAHAALNTVRDQFTLKISKKDDPKRYLELASIFKSDFNEIGKGGTYDDILSEATFDMIEIPYYSWFDKLVHIRSILKNVDDDKYQFEWPLIRDKLQYCHALLNKYSITIAPHFPFTEMIPTFYDCQRRVFMSATIRDDSSIIRTFGANSNSISKPITSSSLAGISERMIIVMELTKIPNEDIEKYLKKLVETATTNWEKGTVILTPSGKVAEKWADIADYADTSEKVSLLIERLQKGDIKKAVVLKNRYDGIDLKNNSCRILILDGLPQGFNEFEQFQMNTIPYGLTMNSQIGKRLEQGMGRGARGSGDYCIVLLTGKDLVTWISRRDNLKFITSSTRAQLKIGESLSREVGDVKDFVDLLRKCLTRDKEWEKYHAESLANIIKPDDIDCESLEMAEKERESYRFEIEGESKRAISLLDNYLSAHQQLDPHTRGWLLQVLARMSYQEGLSTEANNYQRRAFASNKNLLRPRLGNNYEAISIVGDQAQAICSNLEKFEFKRGYISSLERIMVNLTPSVSSNQFEQALEDLGDLLGFQSERPENTYNMGPDVLWLVKESLGFVIEAKSRKEADNPLKKAEHGQLLNASVWFNEKYKKYDSVNIVVHPNNMAQKNVVTGVSKVLTFSKLYFLLDQIKKFYGDLCGNVNPKDNQLSKCQELLQKYELTPELISTKYLERFQNVE